MPDEEPKPKTTYKLFRIRLEGDDLAAIGLDNGNWLNALRARRLAEQSAPDLAADDDDKKPRE